MSIKNSTIVFDAALIGIETWKLKQLEETAHNLLCHRSELCALIQPEDVQSNSFFVLIAHVLKKPILKYRAVIISEDVEPHLDCIYKNVFLTLA